MSGVIHQFKAINGEWVEIDKESFDTWAATDEVAGRCERRRLCDCAEIEALRKDKDRLDAIEGNCWDIRYDSSPNGDAGDSNISIEVVGHWMDKPFERVVGENYNEDLRAAIDQAMTADAYPPARPEYKEHDELEGV